MENGKWKMENGKWKMENGLSLLLFYVLILVIKLSFIQVLTNRDKYRFCFLSEQINHDIIFENHLSQICN